MKKKRFLFSFCSIILVFSFLFVPLACCTTGATTRLIAGLTQLHEHQNPFQVEGRFDVIVMSRIYEPLVVEQSGGVIAARLAKSWSYDASTMKWTFNLDERAEWSDGEPVTADDVVFSLKTYWKNDYAGGAAAKVSVIADDTTATTFNTVFDAAVKKVDDHTVTVKVTEYVGAYLDFLNSMYIVPMHIWGDIADVDAYTNTTPVGSGPFLWTEYTAQSHVLFTANPNYWGGKMHVDELLVKIYGSAELAIIALKTGDIDIVPTIELFTQVPVLLAAGGVTVGIDITSNSYGLLYVDHRDGANGEKAFRQAVSMAIDRVEIIGAATHGYASIPRMCAFVPDNIAYDAEWPGTDKTDAQRIAAANTQLDTITLMSKTPDPIPDEGFTRKYDDEDLNIELTISPGPEYVSTAQIIKENMAELGINITVKLKAGGMMGMMFGGGWDEWEWALVNHGAGGSTISGLAGEYGADPYDVWYDAAAVGWGTDGAGGGTATALDLQQKMRDAKRESNATTLTTLLQEIQTGVADELPVVPLYKTQMIYAYRASKFTGWDPVEELDGNGSSGHLLSTTSLLTLRPVE